MQHHNWPDNYVLLDFVQLATRGVWRRSGGILRINAAGGHFLVELGSELGDIGIADGVERAAQLAGLAQFLFGGTRFKLSACMDTSQFLQAGAALGLILPQNCVSSFRKACHNRMTIKIEHSTFSDSYNSGFTPTPEYQYPPAYKGVLFPTKISADNFYCLLERLAPMRLSCLSFH